MSWRPIDTAPKDGTWVLVTRRGCGPEFVSCVSWRTYHPNAAGKAAWRDAAGHQQPLVTHWMPLPELPR